MTEDEFDRVVTSKIAAKPQWFSSAEAPLSRSDIDQEQRRLGFSLPKEYIHFAERFGAGYFGTINVSSLDCRSSWYRWGAALRISNIQSLQILSDDEAGGYYGVLLSDGICGREIYYIHPDDGFEVSIVSDNFFEFILKFAFDFTHAP
jgi:hypothetical protein